MNQFQLYSSNHLEVLAAQLIEAYSRDKESISIFETTQIITQNKATNEWLTRFLTEHLGIFANYHFSFAHEFIETVFSRCYYYEQSVQKETYQYDINDLTWFIFAFLQEQSRQQDKRLPFTFNSDKICYLFAEKMALIFEKYDLYRTNNLDQFIRQETPKWQQALWQELQSVQDYLPRFQLWQNFIKKSSDQNLMKTILPRHLFIFNVPFLPPLYLEFFQKISAFCQTHFFLLNPSKELWFNETKTKQRNVNTKQNSFKIERNSLLQTYAKETKALLKIIVSDMQLTDDYGFALFFDHQDKHLLADLKQSILSDKPFEVATTNTDYFQSLQLHSCHNEIRALSVAKDLILSILENNPALEPADILVLTPDLDKYLPFIDPIFSQEPKLHVHQTLQNNADQQHLASAWCALLLFPLQNFTINDVFELLNFTPFQKKLAIKEYDLKKIKAWLVDVGVKWGFDLDEKTTNDNFINEYSWNQAIERILLGMTMWLDPKQPYNGYFVYDQIAHDDLGLIIKIIDFIKKLKTLFLYKEKNITKQSLGLTDWANFITELQNQFFTDPPGEKISQLITRLNKKNQFNQDVNIDYHTFLQLVKRSLSMDSVYRFLSGEMVNFCALDQYSSYPSQVKILIGMDEDTDKTNQAIDDHDCIKKKPKHFDLSELDSDRQRFLESLITTSQKLYLIYTGQDTKDNNEIMPSILVQELLDYLKMCLNEQQQKQLIIVKHKLHAHHPIYYQDNQNHFTYTKKKLNIGTARREKSSFIQKKTTAVTINKHIDFEVLIQFFRNTSRFYIQNSLKFKLHPINETIDANEPFLIEDYKKSQWLYQLVNTTQHTIQNKIKNTLPLGWKKQMELNNLQKQADYLSQTLLEYGIKKPHQEEKLLSFQDYQIKTQLSFSDNNLFEMHIGKLTADALLNLWLKQLLLKVNQQNINQTLLFHFDFKKIKVHHFTTLQSTAKTHLATLLRFYEQGYSYPIPFFNHTSVYFLEQKNKDKNLEKITQEWKKNEGRDRYHDLCFTQNYQLQNDFIDCTTTILSPLMDKVNTH